MHNMGLISKIQRFSLGDGPGIRTTVFMQGCNLCCPWCHNPETLSGKGAILQYANQCGMCGKCQDACPERIIQNCRIADRSRCTLCGRCEAACPNKAIRISGERMDVDSVFNYIMEDMPYYAKSGGGVTISGGEPLLQTDFCGALSERCSGNGVHVIIDTAGNVPFSAFEELIPYTDCFFFDIKTDRAGIGEVGGDSEVVYGNLKALSEKYNVVVRIPVIPGFTDRDGMLETIAMELHGIGVRQVQLLPFHRLALGKYGAMGLEYPYAGLEPSEITDGQVTAFTRLGIACGIDG